MPGTVYTTPEPKQIREIFTAISPKYDFLNSFLSLGIDSAWRKWAVRTSLDGHEKSILDIGTGTGKFLKLFLEQGHFEKAVGLDLCESMLEIAKTKVSGPVTWCHADVSRGLPFTGSEFDLVSAAFTLRSMPDLEFFFKEVKRVLNPGGKAVFLELTRPANPFLSLLYYPYLKVYLPAVGTVVSRSFKSYSFLANSILHFEQPAKVRSMLLGLGFRSAEVIPYTGGIATLIKAKK